MYRNIDKWLYYQNLSWKLSASSSHLVQSVCGPVSEISAILLTVPLSMLPPLPWFSCCFIVVTSNSFPTGRESPLGTKLNEVSVAICTKDVPPEVWLLSLELSSVASACELRAPSEGFATFTDSNWFLLFSSTIFWALFMLTKFSTEFGCICGDLVGGISSLCFRLLFLPSTLTGDGSGKITSSNSSGWRKVGHVRRN